MASFLDQGDRDFLQTLHRLGSATVQDVCAATNVTATAVRNRLNRLQSQGLVTRETVRAGRGRPHHVYGLTERAHRELGDNYSDLAVILWEEIRQVDDPRLRGHLLNRVQQALVQRYGGVADGDEAIGDRFEQLAAAMRDRGLDVEVDRSGELPILRENNCPYHELAETDSGICELEQRVFETVLGATVVRSQCCLDGHHCCEFHPVEELSGSAVPAEPG